MSGNVKGTELGGITKAYEGNGRKLGYPTANINVKTDLDDGVYFGFASILKYKNHPAIIFIGTPVTVGATAHRVEVHLLDIEDKDYHGNLLKITVQEFYRPNKHFASIELLLEAMKEDELAARKWFLAINN